MAEENYKSSRSKSGRKRGGQPGNKNGLRHGFYSTLYSLKRAKELKECTVDDELAILRVKTYELARLTPLKSPGDEERKNYDRFINSIITINNIERTLLLARGHGGEEAKEIWKAIMELNPDEDLE